MNTYRVTPLLVGAALLASLTGCATAATEAGAPETARHDHAAAEGVDGASLMQIPAVVRELAAAREASATYRQLQRAEDAGYALPPAPAPLHECIAATDGHGAMGLHYVDGELVDTKLSVTDPEVLIYEPTADGGARLVAAEYVVFADAWRAEHGDEIPQLFGRDLAYVGEGNRYEVPPFFQVHVWLWKHNPDGIFADHNPRVQCTPEASEPRPPRHVM